MPGPEIFGEEERKEVLDVLNTGVLMRYNHDDERKNIWKAKTFEQEFAAYHDVKYCHMCASGTSADAIALAACGVGVGDEVIVTPFSFIAPVETVLEAGAVPVFAEIDETLCLAPEGIKAAITPRTKAVLLVQVFGGIGKMDEIIQVCEDNNLLLIEDAAPALGSSQHGKRAGTFGKMGCFSFDFYKIITAGEGGAVITNDEACYNKSHMYGDHGHDHKAKHRGADQHPILGFNYRISELNAAVGLAQFRKLAFIIERLRANKKILKEGLRTIPQLHFRHVIDEEGDSATCLAFFLPDKATTQRVKKAFDAQGIPCTYWLENNFHYVGNWDHLKNMQSPARLPITCLEKIPNFHQVHLPQTESIMEKMLMIEIKVKWTREEVTQMRDKMGGILQEIM